MALLRQAFDSVREISVQRVQSDAERPFRIALIGREEFTEAVFDALVGPSPTDPVFALALERVVELVEPNAECYDTIVLCDAAHAPRELALSLLTRMPNHHLSLGRTFPGLREAVTERLIRQSARTNAELSMISAIPSVVPFAGLLIPSIGDMWVITKNQVMLMMKIAAIHGMAAEWRERMPDILPIAGNAFAWRSVTRQILGTVPGGVGIAVKGASAYSGTYVVGKSARAYYTTGCALTAEQQKELFRRIRAEATAAARAIMSRLRRKRRPKDDQLPPSDGE